MNFASDEEELRFLSIFAKTEEMSSIDIASKQMREREEKTKNATKNATQQLTLNYRKNQKVKGAEKQRLAQFEVTNQGYASALHLHRNQNALNRASRDEVDEYSRRTAPTAGLPTAVVKGDKVETPYGAGVVQEVRNNGSDLLVALKFGTIHLPTKSLINNGIGPDNLDNTMRKKVVVEYDDTKSTTHGEYSKTLSDRLDPRDTILSQRPAHFKINDKPLSWTI